MAGDLVFPWAREYDADQLAAFLDDLWGAAGSGDDLTTLDAIEAVIAEHGPRTVHCPLTERELNILTELASGETKVSAGRNLGLSTETVRARCQQIYARLGAKNIAHATAIAARHGWLRDRRVSAPLVEPHAPLGWSWIRKHKQYAAALRQRPGCQLPIGPYTSLSGARDAARNIRRGEYDPYRPAGAFAAQAARADQGHFIVRARYIGTPDIAERHAS